MINIQQLRFRFLKQIAPHLSDERLLEIAKRQVPTIKITCSKEEIKKIEKQLHKNLKLEIKAAKKLRQYGWAKFVENAIKEQKKEIKQT